MKNENLSASEREAFDEGFDAAFNGRDELGDNRYATDTNEFLSWNDGYHSFLDMQDEQQREADAGVAAGMTDPVLARLQALSPQQMADLVEVPLARWPGKCHAISALLVKALRWSEAAAVYGLYLGEVSPACKLFKQGTVRHGWIATRAGVLVDPTWWVFQACEPTLRVLRPGSPEYLAHAQDYDEGAESLCVAYRGPWPQAQAGQPTFDLEDEALLSRLRLEVWKHHPGEAFGSALTLAQLNWLCRTPYSHWGTDAASRLYAQMQRLGHEALVPTDFMARATREQRWPAE